MTVSASGLYTNGTSATSRSAPRSSKLASAISAVTTARHATGEISPSPHRRPADHLGAVPMGPTSPLNRPTHRLPQQGLTDPRPARIQRISERATYRATRSKSFDRGILRNYDTGQGLSRYRDKLRRSSAVSCLHSMAQSAHRQRCTPPPSTMRFRRRIGSSLQGDDSISNHGADGGVAAVRLHATSGTPTETDWNFSGTYD